VAESGAGARSHSFAGPRDLKAYQLAYKLAMDIFKTSRTFPEDERYSLTSQVRRSSRSVAANLAEGYRKRQCPTCSSVKWLIAMLKQPRPRSGWTSHATAATYLRSITLG
jgi:hypothetical protein